MDGIKAWAKSLLMLSVVSSAALLIVPSSMRKQVRFVAEMLILLCVVAPLAGLLAQGGRAVLPSTPAGSPGQSSLGRFHAEETVRRVTEIGRKMGIPVKSVSVTTGDAGFTLREVVVCLSERPADETLRAFREALGTFWGVQGDRLKLIVPP